jgi:AcrR family transcriptional regulator
VTEEHEAERERLMDALMDCVLADGWSGVDQVAVCEAARLPISAFEQHFSGIPDLYEETYERNYAVFEHLVFDGFEGQAWRDRLRGAAYAAARYLRDHDREVRFGAIPSSETSELVAASRDRAFQRLIDLIDAGRQEMDDPDSLGRAVAEGVLGSIYATLVGRMSQGEGTTSAETFVPELMYLAVRPYLGHEVASEELTIPAPREVGDG